MRKLVLVMMALAMVITASIAQEKRYGIESAIIKRNSVIKVPAAQMEQTIPSTQYFADYGRKESGESTMNMQGQTFSVFVMMKDDFVYSANLTTKQGTKVKLSSMVDDYKSINYSNLTDEVIKKYQIEKKGNEKILGKDCIIYDLTISVQGQSVKTTVSVWQGITLKSSVIMSGTTMTDEAIEITEGAQIAKEKFELPEGITFTEMNPQ